MKLWIYGDSYAVDWREPWVWQRQFAKRMGVERVYNQACSGTNNEWILKTFADDEARQRPGDIALIFLTDTTRRWWIEDRPELSNLASIINTKDANEFKNQDPKVFDAIIDYYTYLDRPDLTDFRLAMMTDFTDSYTGEVPDPYFGGAEGFTYVLDMLESACGGLLDRIESSGVKG